VGFDSDSFKKFMELQKKSEIVFEKAIFCSTMFGVRQGSVEFIGPPGEAFGSKSGLPAEKKEK
jgi:hypothetical protein